jgi:hypothetical protein
MRYRVTSNRLLTRNPALRHCTRTMYYVVHGTPLQRSPLGSGRPFGTVEAAQLHAKLLAQHGYAGWILCLREFRQEDWPAEQWLIDHEQVEPIVWLQPF